VAGEGVPRVIHEAQSQGCPVIATDIGSTRWQLDGEAGIVIPPANTNALRENMLRVIDEEELRRKLSLNGFRRALEFTYEKQRQKIEGFVRKYCPAGILLN
jgi:glycosyltransferase involved in cell wall biosynthesis